MTVDDRTLVDIPLTGPEKEAESEDKSPGRPTDKNNKEEGSSTTRRFFEDEKTSYVISSKAAGNVARFFNVSLENSLEGYYHTRCTEA